MQDTLKAVSANKLLNILSQVRVFHIKIACICFRSKVHAPDGQEHQVGSSLCEGDQPW